MDKSDTNEDLAPRGKKTGGERRKQEVAVGERERIKRNITHHPIIKHEDKTYIITCNQHAHPIRTSTIKLCTILHLYKIESRKWNTNTHTVHVCITAYHTIFAACVTSVWCTCSMCIHLLRKSTSSNTPSLDMPICYTDCTACTMIMIKTHTRHNFREMPSHSECV